MIISSATDFREAARRRLPRFLFDYIDGGANAERTLARNVSDIAELSLRQRVLQDVSNIRLDSELFGQRLALPIALAPIGPHRHVCAPRRNAGRTRRGEKRRRVLSFDGVGLCR